jgi:hypothetical protein
LINCFPVVYDELRRLAARQPAREKPGRTLQATALVHEAYLRLLGAQALSLSPTTAKRHWRFARAWLFDRLRSP